MNETWDEEMIVSFEEPNLFEDPYSATWIKGLATFSYLLGLIGNLIVGSFAYYQMQGLASHYDTVINQLMNWICLMVSHICPSICLIKLK